MVKKRFFSGLSLAFALLFPGAILAGCGNGAVAMALTDRASEGNSLSIVTTIFPAYDWVREILGDRAGNAELTLLLDDGADMHSYQPTVDDLVKISSCDLFIYVGGESDGWAEDALAGAANKDMTVISLLNTLGDMAKEEETVEGMQAEEEEAPEDGAEYDEHVWLSLRSAEVFCAVIGEKLGGIDPANRELYAKNAEAYAEKLNALDRQFSEAVDAAGRSTILFGDRFPFRYLADDYGLTYYAAFAGCSAETEASFETVIFLANKVDELGLPAVLTIEAGDGRIARTIVENTQAKNAEILEMNSLQSTPEGYSKGGTNYLSAMEGNLEVLKQALR